MNAALKLYVGIDKGKPVVILAPDLDNAQSMVDASTQLALFGFTRPLPLACQGPINAEEIFKALRVGS